MKHLQGGGSVPEPEKEVKEVPDYRLLLSRPADQKGQGLVEYALILIMVSIAAIIILITMGGQVKNLFSNVVLAFNG